MKQRKDVFDLMIKKIERVAAENGDKLPQAFGRWFSKMYFPGIISIDISDGARDGKVDLIIKCQKGREIKYHILNTKFTEEYDKSSPVSFYDEITRFWQAFENKTNRQEYLEKLVRADLRSKYLRLFKLYDDGLAELYFVTNHKINQGQYDTVKNYGIKIYHLDDVLQYLIEDLEGAMPETDPLLLTDIATILTPPTAESEVPTSIVFARLIDFLKYMENDPLELIFARNVRLWLGNTETNKEIRETFKKSPKEFAYSNNGITILCRKHIHNPGQKELTLENPRVVNGSQTLHSIRDIESPPSSARVMVRIIEIPQEEKDLPQIKAKRKEIIHKISIRSNMQNPIKRWNLVANDDFQNELARCFWGKKLYYERRQKEWQFKKRELKEIGISLGPDIRWMMQLIASFYYDNGHLGAANAYGQLNQLFDESSYSIIRETKPEIAYQLYLLDEILDYYLKLQKEKNMHINNLYGYVNLCMFALTCRMFDSISTHKWGDSHFTAFLENEYESENKKWNPFISECIDHIWKYYRKSYKIVRAKQGKDLSFNNYFKNKGYMQEILEARIPANLKAKAKKVFKSS